MTTRAPGAADNAGCLVVAWPVLMAWVVWNAGWGPAGIVAAGSGIALLLGLVLPEVLGCLAVIGGCVAVFVYVGVDRAALYPGGFAVCCALFFGMGVRQSRRARRAPPPSPRRLVWDEGKRLSTRNDPSWSDVASALAALNGKERTMMAVHRDGAVLYVCSPLPSGYNAFQTCSGEFSDETVHMALPAVEPVGEEVEVAVGGLDYQRQLDREISRDTAVEIARWFWERGGGTLNPEVKWSEGTDPVDILMPPSLYDLG